MDAVLCGQSMHWFDMSRAVPEIARVLVPGGALGALWNSDDDRVEWVAGLRDVAKEAGSPVLSSRRAEAAAFSREQFGADLFTPTESAEFPNAQARTADSLLATLGTHSAVLVMEPSRARPAARADPRLPGVAAGDLGRAVRAPDGHLGAPLGPPIGEDGRREAPGRGGRPAVGASIVGSRAWLPRPN